MPQLTLTGNPAADQLLSDNAFALLVGMLLDQQIAMELAFAGPMRLAERLDGPLEPATIARTDLDALEAMFRTKPALHRYPGSMATRVHALAGHLVDEYGGHAAAVWEGATDGADLTGRLRALPGFGDQTGCRKIERGLWSAVVGCGPAVGAGASRRVSRRARRRGVSVSCPQA